MLRLCLSDVLDEELEALGRAVVFAGRVSERGKRAGSLVDGEVHLLVLGLATLHRMSVYSTRHDIKNSEWIRIEDSRFEGVVLT